MPIRQGKGVDWARGKAEEVRSEARRVGARGIEKGRRGLAGAYAGSEALLGLALPELEEKKREGKTDEAPRADKNNTAQRVRFVDGRRVESPAHLQSRYGRQYEHSDTKSTILSRFRPSKSPNFILPLEIWPKYKL